MGGGSDGGGRTSLVVKIEQNVPFIQEGLKILLLQYLLRQHIFHFVDL